MSAGVSLAPQARPHAGKTLSLRHAKWTASICGISCALIWLARGVYVYWDNVEVVNFLAAWIPFAISILLAFVADREMTERKRIAWRGTVIIIGFVWSFVLWHQQIIADTALKQDQQNMVTQAVTQSNEHSDGQIHAVRQDVAGVKDQIGTVRDDLKNQQTSFSKMLTDSTSSLNTSISKVGKPEPPQKTNLEFMLWPPTDVPLLAEVIQPDKDGVFTVDFTFRNTSDTRAENTDVWVLVCDICEFAAEPSGFDRPAGISEKARHLSFNILNPGTTFAMQSIKVRFKDPARLKDASSFQIAFRYACQACGKPEKAQIATVVFTPQL